jgi:glycosyltransferase involved in cell wall biosynthesis
MTEITRPDTESRLAGAFRHAITHMVRRITYPEADLAAANSADGVMEVVRHYHVDQKCIRRLPNLVEPARLAELAACNSTRDDEIPSICVVSRLDPLKRIDTLLEAAAGLPPDQAWRIQVLGDGPAHETLSSLAARLGISDRVTFHGWVKNPYPAISHAAVTVLTSAYEGFSNTVLEAMALRTPVITSLCSTDAFDMCQQGAALGFPVGDHIALRAHLKSILSDQTLRQKLTAAAWHYAQSHTIPQAIPEYEALVRDAIAARSGLLKAPALHLMQIEHGRMNNADHGASLRHLVHRD